jgi:DME family drug/metabolite transporter
MTAAKGMPRQRHPLRGCAWIALAALQWGIAASLGRAVFTGRLRLGGEVIGAVDPLALSQARASISLVVLAVALLASRGLRPLLLPARDLARVTLLGTLGVAASNYLYYLAIQRTNVATAIIVQYTAPVWVLLYMVGRGQQKATLKHFAGVGLAVVGIALVIDVLRGGLKLDRLGLLAALLAAFAFTLYNVTAHDLLRRYDRWKVLLWALVSASLFWVVVNPPWKVAAAHYNRGQWMFLSLFALVSLLGPFSCYFAGLQHLTPSTAVVTSCLEPVFSILIAALALGEGLNSVQGSGVVLVLLAITLVQWPERGKAEVVVVEPVD